MRVVNVNDLKEIKFISNGTYGIVVLVEFEGKMYCYKEIKYPFSDDKTLIRVSDFTDLDLPSSFMVPLYMVEDNRGRILGYLTDYNKDLVDIDDCFERREKLLLIKSARNLIEDFHNEYKYVHGDPHFGNILCNKNNLTTSLIDYDLLDAICFDTYEIPEMNKDVKRLSKELLLQDTKKPYSGEYIIDHII